MQTNEEIPNNKPPRNFLWMIIGALATLLIIIVVSYLQGDASMRVFPVLIFFAAPGALAGRGFSFMRNSQWSNLISFLLGLFFFGLAVFLGFLLAQVSSF